MVNLITDCISTLCNKQFTSFLTYNKGTGGEKISLTSSVTINRRDLDNCFRMKDG